MIWLKLLVEVFICLFNKMMFIDNKEEVGVQGQRSDEPNIGVPIKKRFQLANPSSLKSSAPSFDTFTLTPKHFTPKSTLDFPLSGFDPGNPSSSDLNKPAGVAMNRLHDLNAVDMGRNYGMLKPSSSSGIRMEMPQVGNAPKLHLSISDDMLNKEKSNQCSTDLSLTSPSTVSKASFKPSYNLSNNMEERSFFDLNIPTSETWESTMNGYTLENDNSITNTKPAGALAKQGSASGMIHPGVGSGVIPNEAVSGLVPNGSGNNRMLPNLDKSYGNYNLSEVTLDLQLKLPPRPELRMKNMEAVCSSDLSLSLSGKDLDTTPETLNVKHKPVYNSQGNKNKDITDHNAKPVAQSPVIIKRESHEVVLPEKVAQASGFKDQNLASGSVVKKEPIDSTRRAQHPLGKLLDKSPSSGSESRLDKQTKTSETNNLTKGIDLNFATPSPVVSTVDKTVYPILAESAVADHIVQPTISQSEAHHNHEKIDSRELSLNTPSLASTSSLLVGTEDIKPVIAHNASQTLVVDNSKRMTFDGLSQGSADMDCSEGHNLPKPGTTCNTMKIANNETNASSSSSVTKIPKQEASNLSEFENIKIKEAQVGENVKGVVASSTPTSKENHIQSSIPAEARFAQNSENDLPSSSTKVDDHLPNKSTEGVSADMETAGGSKSQSPSTSMSRRDKEGDESSDRENGTSSRQSEENNILHRRFKRSDLSPNDRTQFERKKPRMSTYDEGSNFHTNRGRRWGGQRYSQFDGDRFENEGIAMANRNRPTNRFNSRFGHSKYQGFRFTRTHNNPDMNFDEGNDGRNSRPHPRFQNRRRMADASPRGADELDGPVFEHPTNHYKRVNDHTIHRERSSSPGPRRGPHQWTPSGEMIGGHPDQLTRADTRVRSPGRRPFFKKDSFNRRHASPPLYNRGRGRGRGMHWSNGRQHYDVGAPHGPAVNAQNMGAYDEIRCRGGDMMPFHARYPDNDGAFLDGGRPHGRGRNQPREVGNQEEYRYNNRGPNGWRDGNQNNDGDKLKRRRY